MHSALERFTIPENELGTVLFASWGFAQLPDSQWKAYGLMNPTVENDSYAISTAPLRGPMPSERTSQKFASAYSHARPVRMA